MTDAGRLDKWLFHARLCPSRAAAQAAAGAGKIRLSGRRVEKPGQVVRPGDVLTVALGGQVRALRILRLAVRRGSAAEALTLYEPLE